MSNLNNQPAMPPKDTSPVIKFGLSVVFIVFGILGGWMAYAPLAISIVGTGEVSVDTNKKTIQHYEGGIVSSILVKEGDFVKKGDIIITLDSTQIESSLKTNQNQYFETIATIARLEAQKKRAVKIVFPKDIESKKNEVKIKAIIDGQYSILKSKLKSVAEERIITKQKVNQFKNQILSLNSSLSSNKKRLVSIKSDIDSQESLFAEKLVDINLLQELRREEIKINGDIQSSEADKKRLYSQIEETKSQLVLRNREFDNEIVNKLVENEIRKIDLESKISVSDDQLERFKIIAPESGYVVGLKINTIGAVIKSSEEILDIVPKDSDLFILTQVQTQDIDKLEIGLKADTRFSAFNTQQTFSVESEIIHISADNFTNEQTGQPYYEVKLKLTEAGIIQLKENKFFLLPGMPVETMINTGDRTVLSYLVKPFRDMLSRSFNEE